MADLTNKIISTNFQKLLQTDDGVIQDGTGSAYAIRLSGSSNVGINTDPVANATLKVGGDIRATGDIIAERYIVSSSVTHLTQSLSSGSTQFGDSVDDTHKFSGSLSDLGGGPLKITGDISASGTLYGNFVEVRDAIPKIRLTDTDATNNAFGEVLHSNGILTLRADEDGDVGGSMITFEIDGTQKVKI